MRIAILGAGNVGEALGKGWSRVGHSISYGVRDPADRKYQATSRTAGGAEILAVADAARKTDVVVLAVPWDAVPAALKACGDLSGRIVIDATNPLRMGKDGLELALGFDRSGAEEIARIASDAKVVKTMNQVGFEVVAAASGYPVKPAMFVSSDHSDAKQMSLGLVADLGFDAIDAGDLRISRLLEPYALLWIDQALAHDAPRHSAFAFMRTPL